MHTNQKLKDHCRSNSNCDRRNCWTYDKRCGYFEVRTLRIYSIHEEGGRYVIYLIFLFPFLWTDQLMTTTTITIQTEVMHIQCGAPNPVLKG